MIYRALLLLLLLSSGAAAAPRTREKNTTVAVVGAGVASSFLANFLLGASSKVSVAVFEKQEVPGGRVKSVNVTFGEEEVVTVDVGASIAYEGNMFVRRACKQLALKTKKPAEDDFRSFGIYDPEKRSFSYLQPSALPLPPFAARMLGGGWLHKFSLSAYQKLHLLGTFGYDLKKLFDVVKTAAKSLDLLYEYLDAGRVYRDEIDVWDSVGMASFLNVSFYDMYNRSVSVSSVSSSSENRLLTTISAMVNRVNYNHPTKTIPVSFFLIENESVDRSWRELEGIRESMYIYLFMI